MTFLALILSLHAHAALTPNPAVAAHVQKAEKDGWTDDELVELYKLLSPADRDAAPALRKAVANLKFPEEGRPRQFFDAIASYLDGNRGAKLPKSKLESAIAAVTTQYLGQLKDSQTGKGAQQELAAALRVKTWKYLQKLELFRAEMKKQKVVAWGYQPFPLPPFEDDWEKEHTITTASDFQKRVCDASKEKPVLVKFGSTQCADCMLMEYTQGIRSFAEKHKESVEVYKVWWGPNLSKDVDDLRKREGAKSSPSFVMYKDGKRHACPYQFPDQQAGGADIEKCIAVQGEPAGACGT